MEELSGGGGEGQGGEAAADTHANSPMLIHSHWLRPELYQDLSESEREGTGKQQAAEQSISV